MVLDTDGPRDGNVKKRMQTNMILWRKKSGEKAKKERVRSS